MNQLSSSAPASRPVLGAGFMVGTGLAFAMVNTITPILTYITFHVPSTAVVFWQYVIATLFALPLIFRIGLGKLKTQHPALHEVRAFVSAAGVQVFAFGFASGVPVWQMVALSMTAPFFIIAGSILFLGEKVTAQRVLASIVGFVGALLVAGVGTGGFSWYSLLPVIATALWATANLLTKYLASKGESAESLTLYLLVLITPNHLLIGLLLGAAVWLFPGALPTSLANGFDFSLPGGGAFWLIVLLGLITAASQYLNSLAYKVADATYLQPFDDLKLPMNTLAGWLLLGQVPTLWFWPGAALILAASIFILQRETRIRHAKATGNTAVARA